MKGIGPLDNNEIRLVSACFEGTYEARNRGLLIQAGLNGHLATHSLRKSFAQRLYEQTGDIFAVQEMMLGHKSVTTTQTYLGVNYSNVREALEKMSLDSELHDSSLLGSSLKNITDETLLLELALRGYDLSSLPKKRRTARLGRSSR